MESNSYGNRILCSDRAYKLLKEQAPEIPKTKRGKISVKGKGDMTVYWVGGGNWTGADLLKKDEEDGSKRVGFEEDKAGDVV